MVLFLLKTLFFSNYLFAGIIPVGIDDSKSDTLIDSFNSVYSGANTKHSYALGKEASISMSSSYLDLSDLNEIGSNSNGSKSLLINYLNISKGLYANFDLGLSSILPTDSEESVSGFGGYINWLKIYQGISFKPGAYLYSLNVNNVFNSFNAGFSLSAFKQFSLLTIGAHYSIESNEINVNAQKNNTDIFLSGRTKNKERIYHSIGASIALEAKNFDIILQPTYSLDSDLIISAKLNFNL